MEVSSVDCTRCEDDYEGMPTTPVLVRLGKIFDNVDEATHQWAVSHNTAGLDGVRIDPAEAIIRRKTMGGRNPLYSSDGQGGASESVSARKNSMLVHQSADLPSHSGTIEGEPSANLKTMTPADLVVVG